VGVAETPKKIGSRNDRMKMGRGNTNTPSGGETTNEGIMECEKRLAVSFIKGSQRGGPGAGVVRLGPREGKRQHRGPDGRKKVDQCQESLGFKE